MKPFQARVNGKGLLFPLLMLGLLITGAVGATEAPDTGALGRGDNKPNVLIMVADDLGWADMGYRGSAIETPALDSLAQEGVRLNRFYTAPICSPTRAALMTGRDPLKLGVGYATIKPWHNYGVAPQEHFMPESFQAAGYQTAMFGKWHLGHAYPELHPNQRGFDYFFGHLLTSTDYFTHKNQGAPDLQRNGKTVDKTGQYGTDLIGEETVAWIKNRDKSQPFFAYVPFTAPHLPLQAPEQLVEKYGHIPNDSRRVYAAMVDAMDASIQQILDTLEQEGIADNTLVLFFSDNGGSKANAASNAPYRGFKGETFEGGIRVAATLRWPDRLAGDKDFDQVITATDLFPTLAAATGVEINSSRPLDGKNLWTNLETGVVAPRQDKLFFTSESPLLGRYYNAVLDGDWKLVQLVDHKLENITVKNMLFDLSKDPYEQTDLAASHPKKVAALAGDIHQWRTQHPAAGVRVELVPHPGWRAPKDWAQSTAAMGEVINLERGAYGFYSKKAGLPRIDRMYGERGRLIYQ